MQRVLPFSYNSRQVPGRHQPVCLFFKMRPDRMLAMKNDTRKAKGYKLAKDRTAVLFCVNKTGTHKLKPLCIRKYMKPYCFHHVNMETVHLAYTASGNVWKCVEVYGRRSTLGQWVAGLWHRLSRIGRLPYFGCANSCSSRHTLRNGSPSALGGGAL